MRLITKILIAKKYMPNKLANHAIQKKGICMEDLTDTNEVEKAERINSYIQYRIAQKFSAGEDVLMLLPSADIKTCLYILEQIDAMALPEYNEHRLITYLE
jgi:hypothetical protein